MTNTELIGRIAAALIKGELYERVGSYINALKVFFRKIYEPVSEKTNNVGFGQVQHKPGCTSTEAG